MKLYTYLLKLIYRFSRPVIGPSLDNKDNMSEKEESDEKSNVLSFEGYKRRKGISKPKRDMCINCGKIFEHWWTSRFFFCINFGESHEPFEPDDGGGGEGGFVA